MSKIACIETIIQNKSPLYISDGDDLLVYKNKSYLPATTIAGSFSDYLKSLGEYCGDLFGTDEDGRISRIYFNDSYANVLGYDYRTEIKINQAYGITEEGSKRNMTYFNSGMEFNLSMKIMNYKEDDIDLIIKCLNALNSGDIRIGGNKSNGLGIFEVKNLEIAKYDLTDKSHFLDYLLEKKELFKDESSQLKVNRNDKYYYFELGGNFTTPILISSVEMFNSSLDTDESHIKSADSYIIPGSVIKGVLRSRMTLIAEYLGYDANLVSSIFGEVLEENDEEKKRLSRVMVEESKLENVKENVYHRVKIDKFTGGVMQGALMDMKPVQGEAKFKIRYLKTDDEYIDRKIVYLICLSLRDLANEDLEIGSRNSIGFGRFRGDEEGIVVFNGDKPCYKYFEKDKEGDHVQ